jgi:hypothetical protein
MTQVVTETKEKSAGRISGVSLKPDFTAIQDRISTEYIHGEGPTPLAGAITLDRHGNKGKQQESCTKSSQKSCRCKQS